jgi:hypothetical protein
MELVVRSRRDDHLGLEAIDGQADAAEAPP